MMPPKKATDAPEITEIAMIPAEDKEEGVFLFGESGLFDPLSPLDLLEEELLEFVPSLELVSMGIRSYTAANVTSSVTTNV